MERLTIAMPHHSGDVVLYNALRRRVELQARDLPVDVVSIMSFEDGRALCMDLGFEWVVRPRAGVATCCQLFVGFMALLLQRGHGSKPVLWLEPDTALTGDDSLERVCKTVAARDAVQPVQIWGCDKGKQGRRWRFMSGVSVYFPDAIASVLDQVDTNAAHDVELGRLLQYPSPGLIDTPLIECVLGWDTPIAEFAAFKQDAGVLIDLLMGKPDNPRRPALIHGDKSGAFQKLLDARAGRDAQ